MDCWGGGKSGTALTPATSAGARGALALPQRLGPARGTPTGESAAGLFAVQHHGLGFSQPLHTGPPLGPVAFSRCVVGSLWRKLGEGWGRGKARAALSCEGEGAAESCITGAN